VKRLSAASHNLIHRIITLAVQVKSRKRGSGFVAVENWPANYDARRNNSDPLVCVLRVWARLLKRVGQ
jgi:hypothetical protein